MTQDEARILARVELARRHLAHFIEVTNPKYIRTDMHDVYIGVLNKFAHGEIQKLIISMPPQHGKSEVSTRRLPAYMIGHNPELKIGVLSYAQTKARKFGREIKQILDNPKYRYIFPNTRTAGMKDKNDVNRADEISIPDHTGGMIFAGRGRGITGEPFDVLIMDDLYKDAKEANSPVIRNGVIEWYDTVVDARCHNETQQLIVFTRWHLEDLVGYFESQGLVEELTSLEQLKNPKPEIWYKLNFPAIKTGDKTDFDHREAGEPLWKERHSIERLLAARKKNEEVFDALYQGNPLPKKGMLYTQGFEEYDRIPDTTNGRFAYFDTADQGKDYLCGWFGVLAPKENKIYITDCLYTQEGQEVTEPESAKMLIKNRTDTAYIESNAGGRAFARNLQKEVSAMGGRTRIDWFTQRENKEARILTNAYTVMQTVVFPRGWRSKWANAAQALLTFKKLFASNTHDDAPDSLTGLVEKVILNKNYVQVPDRDIRGIAGL